MKYINFYFNVGSKIETNIEGWCKERNNSLICKFVFLFFFNPIHGYFMHTTRTLLLASSPDSSVCQSGIGNEQLC